MSKDTLPDTNMSIGKVTKIAPPEYHNIPQELIDHDVWINFSSTWNDEKQKWGKPPCDNYGNFRPQGFYNVGQYANTKETQENRPKAVAGVGFSFATKKHKGIVGLDFDHVVAKDGTILPEVESILIEIGSYTEYSISGDGLHVFVEAEGLDLGDSKGKRAYNNVFGTGTGLEIFKSTGYLTVSGKRIDRFGTTVRGKCKTKLERLVKKYGKKQAKKAVRDIVDATGEPMFGEVEIFRREFEKKVGIKIKRGVERDDGSWMLYLNRCPWGGSEDAVAGTHENGTSDAVIFFKSGCQPGFYCFHTTCEGHRWDDLCELFPELPIGNYIDRYNAEYCIVSHKGKVFVVRNGIEQEEDMLGTAKEFRAFFDEKAADKIVINNPAGEDKIIRLARAWTESKHARRYLKGFILAPEEKVPEEKLNLWTGFAKQPNPAGSCELFNKHCLEVLCNGDQKVNEWVRMWFADILQNPGKRPAGSCILVKGAGGAGKSIVAELIGEIIGDKWVTEVCSAAELTGKFNAHMVTAMLVIGAEITFKGDHARHEILKGLTTVRKKNLNEKNVPIIRVPNMTRLFLSTNAKHAIPASRSERRFLILKVAGKSRGRAYFDALLEQMENGGYERLMYELLQIKVDRNGLRYVPKTKALQEEKVDSLEGMDRFIHEFLTAGVVPDMTQDESLITWAECETWGEHTTIKLLHQRYKALMDEIGLRKADIITCDSTFSRVFRAECKTMGIVLEKATKAKNDKRIILPPLAVWRAKWDEHMLG